MQKILFTILFLLTIIVVSEAQHLAQYSNYMFNKLAYNPAYAGSREALTANAIYRNQWQGIDGAPTTVNANIHAPFWKNKCGLGLSIVADKIGMLNTTFINLSYAYTIPVGENSKLGLGIMGRLEHGRIDWTEADALHPTDALINMMETSQLQPNFGAGAYLTNDVYYVGISMPQILKNTLYSSTNQASNVKTTYFMAGLVFELNDNIKFKPSALVSYNPSAPLDLDINAMLLFMDALWIGATYRKDDSFDAVLQYQLTQQLRAGLATDFTISDLRQFTTGSFEVMLEYTFDYGNENVMNLRYF